MLKVLWALIRKHSGGIYTYQCKQERKNSGGCRKKAGVASSNPHPLLPSLLHTHASPSSLCTPELAQIYILSVIRGSLPIFPLLGNIHEQHKKSPGTLGRKSSWQSSLTHSFSHLPHPGPVSLALLLA